MDKPSRLEAEPRGDLLDYLKATGWGWWVAVGGIFGFWDQLARFLPAGWSEEVPTWAPEAVAFIALLVGPFLAWRKQRRQLLRLQAQWWRGFAETEMEAIFGSTSRTSIQKQFEEVGAKLDARINEVRHGNFSRAGEIIPVVRTYMPLLSRVVPYGSVAYGNRETEIKEILKKVEAYMSEITED